LGLLIVQKESAIMGGERSIALNGDHLEIAKYESDQDKNFRIVVGNLASLVDQLT
jgi:hypothetical protein